MIGFLFTNIKPYKEFDKLFNFEVFANKYLIAYIFGQDILEPSKTHVQIKFGKFYVKIHAFLHNCLLWQKRNLSLAYKLKANCYFGSKSECSKNSSFLNFYKLRRNLIERTAVRAFGNSIGILILSRLIHIYFHLRSMKLRSTLIKFECFIIPYGGRISIEQDFLIWFSKNYMIKTIAIQENWDNLSSKTLLLMHPDFFATWGKQSSLHLIKIHNFKGRALEVGSLRIKEFYENRKVIFQKEFTSNINYESDGKTIKNLLLIGTGDAEFDLIIAKKCVALIEQYSDEFKSNFNLIYRPHPYTRISTNEYMQISNLKGITIDKPEEKEANNYRIDLIKNSTLIIALYSTVILEASILNKPCIIPSFFDLTFEYNTGDYLNEAEHYAGVASLEGVFNARTSEEFIGILKHFDVANLPINNDLKFLNWFCVDDDTSESILDIVNLPIKSKF